MPKGFHLRASMFAGIRGLFWSDFGFHCSFESDAPIFFSFLPGISNGVDFSGRTGNGRNRNCNLIQSITFWVEGLFRESVSRVIR